MKRILALLLCGALCLSLSVTALAADTTTRDLTGETALAAQLKMLGLFEGVGENADGTTDFALDRAPNRTEALVMLVRALGKETEALKHEKTHPFTDVPAWADGYVSYAYEQGLTKGVSPTLFGARDTVSGEMFLSFMLRALGYTDGVYNDFVWNAPWPLAAWCGLLPSAVDQTSFLRADAVDVTAAALYANRKGKEATLAEALIAQDVFTQKQFDAAFPRQPFAQDHTLDSQISAAIEAKAAVGKVGDNQYAAQCHYIASCVGTGDTDTVTALVCYGSYSLRRDSGLCDGSSSVAPWVFQVNAQTMNVTAVQTAGELTAGGKNMDDVFPADVMAMLAACEFSMRRVCQMQVQIQLDNGAIAYQQDTYQQALDKAKAALSEVTQTVETVQCTALVGHEKDGDGYKLILVFKAGSILGEGETRQRWSQNKGTITVSPDGLTLTYSSPYTDGKISEGLPPTEGSSQPLEVYTLDLTT